MLKANFNITETGGTGIVQLQSSSDLGITWLDINSPLTLSHGALTVDDTADITIDTSVFIPGQTYQFRLADTSGSPMSHTVSYTIHAISGVTAGIAPIGLTDGGGGDLTFGLHTAPVSSQLSSGVTLVGYDYDIEFWHLLTPTVIETNTNMTTDHTVSASGHVDGVYVAQCAYKFSDGTQFTPARVIKVDGTGAVVIDIQINGFTVTGLSGLQMTDQADIIQAGAAYLVGFLAINIHDPGASGTLVSPFGPANDPRTFTIPADTSAIFIAIRTDAAITDHFNHDFFPNHNVTIT